MANVWTIHSAGGGRTGTSLIGTRIIKIDDGTAYQFSGPSGGTLSTTPGNQLPTPPFDFPPFSWAPPGLGELTWRIRVSTLTSGGGGNQAQGTWRNNNPDPVQDETGTWTAQAGAGVETKCEGDASAASAGGGSNV